MTRWLNEDEQRSWRAFLATTTLLFAALDRELQREAKIPMSYYELLVRLSEAPDRTARMSDLADRSQSSRSRMSHAVARLEERGWVERASFDGDRRGQLAKLTDAGFAALESSSHAHVESVRRLLLDPLTPEQFAQLGEISATVLAALESNEPTP
jgi:DNA-binding MarR family transcriptional regulator